MPQHKTLKDALVGWSSKLKICEKLVIAAMRQRLRRAAKRRACVRMHALVHADRATIKNDAARVWRYVFRELPDDLFRLVVRFV